MAELLLVNPSRLKAKASSARRRKNPLTASERKRVTAALRSKHVTKGEKAAIRRELKAMRDAEKSAAMAGRAKPKRRKAQTKRKPTMAKKTRRTRKSPRKIAKRVKFTRSQAVKYKRKSPRVRRAARTLGKRSAAERIYGINPINMNSLKSMLAPALAGALGGVVINRGYDMLLSKVDFLPDFLKPVTVDESGNQVGGNAYGSAAAKALLAFGAGMALEKTKVISAQNRNAAIGGALVIIAYDLIEGTLLPAVGMDGYQTIAGYQQLNGMGEFVYLDDADESGDYGMEGLGYINSAQSAGVLTGRQFTG
jgi:hypothetical protein